ncbi:uncharacterized protein LOC111060391 [Nilaparvata lugens]|uniref:Sulfakinin n=1 Tax=Nilaparvata lugens TaxID=108931 RepID=U3U9Y5_NILLU|nr:uncharacterized protein LOC111060391 [Nilaparvata lugens]XP_039279256.1 uncharacterized protein LOC111060391 [Nilaparvata lugens]BAO00978.1 sulfakinin [Nilaparvata lugens]
MGCSTMTAVLLTVSVFLLLQHQVGVLANGAAASELMTSSSNDLVTANRGQTGRRRASLPVILSQARPNSKGGQLIRARLTPLEPLISDLLIDDVDDMMEIGKRQSDDYGHMRFGKRGEADDKFDDYGHMRFGRDHV